VPIRHFVPASHAPTPAPVQISAVLAEASGPDFRLARLARCSAQMDEPPIFADVSLYRRMGPAMTISFQHQPRGSQSFISPRNIA